QHKDSLGHRGTIGAGDIQWMTSGSGILHEEMPQVRPEGIGGLQLWLNLPAREKMTRPKYRDLQADRLTETALDEGAMVRVIAGGRLRLAAARPLREPIARHGPFVMNTRAEIEQTLRDLQTGRFIRDEPRDE